eukprot:Rmarinus@m.29998
MHHEVVLRDSPLATYLQRLDTDDEAEMLPSTVQLPQTPSQTNTVQDSQTHADEVNYVPGFLFDQAYLHAAIAMIHDSSDAHQVYTRARNRGMIWTISNTLVAVLLAFCTGASSLAVIMTLLFIYFNVTKNFRSMGALTELEKSVRSSSEFDVLVEKSLILVRRVNAIARGYRYRKDTPFKNSDSFAISLGSQRIISSVDSVLLSIEEILKGKEKGNGDVAQNRRQEHQIQGSAALLRSFKTRLDAMKKLRRNFHLQVAQNLFARFAWFWSFSSVGEPTVQQLSTLAATIAEGVVVLHQASKLVSTTLDDDSAEEENDPGSSDVALLRAIHAGLKEATGYVEAMAMELPTPTTREPMKPPNDNSPCGKERCSSSGDGLSSEGVGNIDKTKSSEPERQRLLARRRFHSILPRLVSTLRSLQARSLVLDLLLRQEMSHPGMGSAESQDSERSLPSDIAGSTGACELVSGSGNGHGLEGTQEAPPCTTGPTGPTGPSVGGCPSGEGVGVWKAQGEASNDEEERLLRMLNAARTDFGSLSAHAASDGGGGMRDLVDELRSVLLFRTHSQHTDAPQPCSSACTSAEVTTRNSEATANNLKAAARNSEATTRNPENTVNNLEAAAKNSEASAVARPTRPEGESKPAAAQPFRALASRVEASFGVAPQAQDASSQSSGTVNCHPDGNHDTPSPLATLLLREAPVSGSAVDPRVVSSLVAACFSQRGVELEEVLEDVGDVDDDNS